ncbi:MAG: sporulation integral membrane protein YtvI [Oscillospiraceae bacterium]|nr:sporulation integral membrane protein YtvI [Oscillospiraceae bacterium]
MSLSALKKPLLLFMAVGGVWLAARFLLPLLLPFLLGGLLALAAEPLVAFGVGKLRMSRRVAACAGVTVTLLLLAGVLSLVMAVLVKELGHLASGLPDVRAGVSVLEDWLLSLADRAPEGIRTLAQKSVLSVFDDGTALMRQVENRLPGMLTTVVSGVGSSVVGVGTGLLSAFLISARLPKLRKSLGERLPQSWQEKWLPMLGKLKGGLAGWCKAQGKLLAVMWGVVTLGFLLIGIPYGPMWALVVALVDAVPVLGTGIVLVPWGLARLLQGDKLQAIGLFCTYGAALVTRTVLEPKLVGRQLGLDPLVTLLAVYIGFRLWGIPGLLLAPVLLSVFKSLIQ